MQANRALPGIKLSSVIRTVYLSRASPGTTTISLIKDWMKALRSVSSETTIVAPSGGRPAVQAGLLKLPSPGNQTPGSARRRRDPKCLAALGLGTILVSLPGYSPHFNADEAIWGWARDEATGNLCLGTKALVQSLPLRRQGRGSEISSAGRPGR